MGQNTPFRLRWLIPAGALLAASAVSLTAGSAPSRPLRVAVWNSPPYEIVAEDGKVGGMSVEVVAEAARRLGYPIEWVPTKESPDRAIPAGKVDLWASLSRTPERVKRFYMTKPWMENEVCLLSLKQSGIRSAADVGEGAVAIWNPPVYGRIVREELPKASVRVLPNRQEAMSSVCRGEAKAALLELRAAENAVLERPAACDGASLWLAPLEEASIPISIGASAGNVNYADALQEEIGRMSSDGSFLAIYSRWFYRSRAQAQLVASQVQGHYETRLWTWLVSILVLVLGAVVFLNRKVTKAKRAAEESAGEARRANLAKSQFLVNMSHEIRTPMNGVLGMTHLLLSSGLNSSQREMADIVRTSAESLLSVLNDLLDLSSIEAGDVHLAHERFRPREVLDTVRKLFSQTALNKNLGFSVRVRDDVPEQLTGDAGRLRQVLVSLVDNAIKFTASGSVEIDVMRNEEVDGDGSVLLEFRIEDTGIGISPEDFSKLFAPFEQADGSMTRKYGGSGLGLAISKNVVQLLGGEIGASSEPGQGSCFWFTARFEPASAEPEAEEQEPELEATAPEAEEQAPPRRFGARAEAEDEPLMASAIENAPGEEAYEEAAAQAMEPEPEPEPPRELVILLAEDNPVNQIVAQKMLRKFGYVVDVASNGREAVEASVRRKYDMVFMDCQMPEMDGLQATMLIRKREMPGEHLPIVALTAHAMESERQRCLAAGMDDFLAKPISPVTFEQMAHRWAGVPAPLPVEVQVPTA